MTLYRSIGTPFGSSPLLLPSVGIRCHESCCSVPGIQDISDCQIVNQSNFCPVRDRFGISCGGIDLVYHTTILLCIGLRILHLRQLQLCRTHAPSAVYIRILQFIYLRTVGRHGQKYMRVGLTGMAKKHSVCDTRGPHQMF